jgi:formate hydrogenlyase subunit 3/multisubunit Na+/H+ antiporter MnhD subunit
MTLFFAAVLVPVVGGGAALLAGWRPVLASRLGAGSAVLGGALGLWFATGVLLGGTSPAYAAPWSVPYGSFSVGADALSAVFLLLAFGLPPVAAVYGAGYLAHYGATRRLGPAWCCFNLLTAAIAVVLVARNAVLFLVAWEVMSLASYFLVVFEDERLEVRRAGWTYLVATHIGTAFLLAFFVLLGARTGSLELAAATSPLPGAGALFLLALIGFGTKAGLVPLHIWLPEAHPAAPSHVSAVMSGVLIKTGVYGVLRTLELLGGGPFWWAVVLVSAGVVSGLVGALFALAQRDLKRLLAYSSVENVGLITVGIGVGVLGRSQEWPALAVLGFGGALFHALNHGAFKALLFLGAGAIRQAAGTLELDELGGLLGRLPWTGLALMVGSAAVAALPPLNGFASELLLLAGGLEAVAGLPAGRAWPALLAVAGVALIGGLAAVAFVKAVGTALLGSPRSAAAAAAQETAPLLVAPLLVLAGLCVAAGVAPLAVWTLLERAAGQLAGGAPADAELPRTVFAAVGRFGAVLLALLVVLAGSRAWLLRGRRVRSAGTWDCGYAESVPRAQYTGSSLVEPVAAFLEPVLPSRNLTVRTPRGLFPRDAWVKTGSADVFRQRLYSPLFGWLGEGFARARRLQHGQLHWYLLYIFATLLVLLAVELGVRR